MKIEIDNKIAERLKKRAEEKDDFNSLEEYVNYILKQVVERLNNEEKDQEFSEEDEEKVKQRLKSLGYMD